MFKARTLVSYLDATAASLDWYLSLASSKPHMRGVVSGCETPPASRLVGIETNPGPKGNPLASLLGSVGAALGSAAGGRTNAKKKRKTARSTPPRSARPPPSKARSRSSIAMSASGMTVMGPAAMGTVRRSTVQTGSFQVPFNTAACQVYTTAGGVAVLATATNSSTFVGASTVMISPYVSASTNVYAPMSFGPQIQRICTSFSMYRIKPGTLRASYRSLVATTTGGNVAIAIIPAEYPTANTGLPFNSVLTQECAISTPTWAACVPFDNARLESILGREVSEGWHYCDFDGTINQPEARQDAFLNICVSGMGLPATTVIGFIVLEGVLEFKHLQDNPTEVQYTIPSSASSSSSSKLPITIDTNVPNTPAPKPQQDTEGRWFLPSF